VEPGLNPEGHLHPTQIQTAHAGVDDLVFGLELNLARKESQRDDVAEQVDERQLTCRCMKGVNHGQASSEGG